MHIENIEEVVELYLREAREVLPRVEASFSKLVSDGDKKIVQIGLQLQNGMAITYSTAKELDEIAARITKRDKIPIVITIGAAPIKSKIEIPKISLKALKPESKSNKQEPPKPKRNYAKEWNELIESVQEHCKNNELEQAEILTLKALELSETLPPDDRRQGVNLELLTEIYFKMNKYEICAPFLVRLLEMYKRCLGKDHPDTGTITHNLAVLYHNWERFEPAIFYYQTALYIKGRALGENHADVKLIKSQFEQLKEAVEKPNSMEQILGKSKPSKRNRRNSLTRTQQLNELEAVPAQERLSDNPYDQ